jgi:acyl-coenzyme A thioesterase PaaI-like protein
MLVRSPEIETIAAPRGNAAPIETTPIALPWPPRRFDFDEPLLRASTVHFERNADAETTLIRRIGRQRIVVDFNRLHTFVSVARDSRDFRLLQLVPEALRFVEYVAPFDPLPEQLWSDDPPMPAEAHLRVATARLLRVLAAHVEGTSDELRNAWQQRGDYIPLFQRASSAADGRAAGLTPLTHQLHTLGNAHAGVIAAHAEQPNYAAMAQRVRNLRGRLGGNRHCPDVLLSQALIALVAQIDRPAQTVTRLLNDAETELWHPTALRDMPSLIHRQRQFEARLRELTLFWRRTCREWLSLRPDRLDWRHIEVLARATQRRLAAKLYDIEDRFEA